jgi:FKBP-type peptidyl-prolyl cis-trans isomerase FkpA
MKKTLLAVLAVGFLFASCNKKLSEEEQFQVDKDIIEQYIEDNNLVASSTPSGLYYVITQQGTGNFPTSINDVTVRYTGKFTDNSIFDQSSEAGATFNLQQVIQGWTEGIPLFREGGEGILILPSKLAYGSNGNSSIPANSVLVFDVELLEIVD